LVFARSGCSLAASRPPSCWMREPSRSTTTSRPCSRNLIRARWQGRDRYLLRALVELDVEPVEELRLAHVGWHVVLVLLWLGREERAALGVGELEADRGGVGVAVFVERVVECRERGDVAGL